MAGLRANASHNEHLSRIPYQGLDILLKRISRCPYVYHILLTAEYK